VDAGNECIWWGDRRVALGPKAFQVLRRLMQHPNQIVTKDDLLDAAWPDTHVSDGVLKLAINQLRAAFDDDVRQPRFIETVHRRGYRWVGDRGPESSDLSAESGSLSTERVSSALSNQD
jgi:DNA-binding winged helix-turn-helix (wHTH) protein